MADNQDLLAMTHVGEDPHKYMKSVTPPVFMNSLHVFDTVKDYFDVDIFDDEFYYGRHLTRLLQFLRKRSQHWNTAQELLYFPQEWQHAQQQS